MNILAKSTLTIAGLFGACSSLSGCAGYGPVEARWNATPVLAPVRAIARKAEDGANEPSVGVVARGGIVNGSAEIRTQRENPIDLTPELNTNGRVTLSDGKSQVQRDCENFGGTYVKPEGLSPYCTYN